MTPCRHGLPKDQRCEACRITKTPKLAYCYSRAEVIALNPIRAAQGHPPLKVGDCFCPVGSNGPIHNRACPRHGDIK